MQIFSIKGGTMHSVTTIAELEILAKVDQDIFEVLWNKESYGRASAANHLGTYKNISVSEKLIRTWREKNIPVIVPTANVGKFNTGKTIVIMPDVQAPLHDVDLVEKFTRFIGDFQPTELAQVGDFTDSTEISRWVRGKKPEFAGDLQAGFDASRDILDGIREVFDGRFRIVRSNHDDRLENYLETCGPGLTSLRDLTLEKQAGFDEYDVEFVRDAVVEIAPGWVMAHGDEGSLSPSGGKTALGLAKNKFGVSVVCGHTHRAGITPETFGYNGANQRVLTGMEVGHFMDMSKADYLRKKGATANWQQGFGILDIKGDIVTARLIYIVNGEFCVDGVWY